MADNIKKYRRPDQQWKCGLQDKGILCTPGPDHRHRCPESTCHPKRTLAWWRSYLQVSFAAVTIATLIVAANLPNYQAVIAPGPLTLSHAQLISNPNDPHRCAACHQDSEKNFFTSPFNKSALDSSSSFQQPIQELSDSDLAKHSQSDRCTACHIQSMPNLPNRRPHDLPLEVVQEMTSIAKQKLNSPTIASTADNSIPLNETAHGKPLESWRNQLFRFISTQKTSAQEQPTTLEQGDLQCSTCHIEHRGSTHDLKAIASGRCQACHQQSFASFVNGHPQFENYPEEKPRRIAFDHRKHMDTHFTKSMTNFDCRLCHIDKSQRSGVGQVFRSLPFEVTCAKCHDASIKSSLSDGVIVFQVPSIDIQGLSNHVPNLNTWPEEASLMMDGKIPPLMQLLLASEPEGAQALLGFDAVADLSKLRVDLPADQKTLTALVNAFQLILEKVANSGQSALNQHLVSSGTSEQDPHEKSLYESVKAILRGAPPDIFRNAHQDWFSSKNGNEKLWKPIKASSHLSQGGWMIDRQRLSISYIPTGHADPWLSNIFEKASDIVESGSSDSSVADRATMASKQILATKSSGQCTECHSDLKPRHSLISTRSPSEKLAAVIDASFNATPHARWRSESTSTEYRYLTKFDHGPHLIQPQLQSCVACHSWNTSRGTNSHLPEFASMKVEQCISCHNPQAAGDHCTQCHNYHVDIR